MKEAPSVAIVAVALAAWVAYWAMSLVGKQEAFAILIALLLVAVIGNLAAKPAWRPPLTRRARLGTVLGIAAAGILSLSHYARVARTNLPFMDPVQLPVYMWLATAAVALTSAYMLLPSGGRPEAPACAACGAPAESSACARCGASLTAPAAS